MNKRILELSFKHGTSHIGSCLTALPIIDEIYQLRFSDEPFILSSGHAGLALYTILEQYEGRDAEALFTKHGVHPNRDAEDGIYCSTGSLGKGLTIAVGMALSDRSKNVYALISDGEAAEGAIYESMRFKEANQLDNLKVYINYNGFSAYAETVVPQFSELLVRRTSCEYIPFLKGLEGHYHVMSEDEYKLALTLI